MLSKSLIKSLFQSIFCLIILLGCDTQKGTSVEASEAQQVDPLAGAEKIQIDTALSIITWIGSRPSRQHNGIIGLNDGFVAISGGALVGARVSIDLSSITVMDLQPDEDQHAKLKNHLMSNDFFDVDNHPIGTFEVTEVVNYDSVMLSTDKTEFSSEYTPARLSDFMVKNPTHFISGNLTLRGVSKNITFPAEVKINGNAVKAEAKFNIDRTDWNLNYDNESSAIDKAKDKFIYNTVNVGFNLETL
ncbi:MAG: YceI family protein [Marinoscillum sp.]